MRALLFCLLAAAAWADDGGAAAVGADAPTVGASLDKTEALVGDRVAITISAVARAGIAVTLPPKLELGKLEERDRSATDKLGLDLGDGRRAHKFVVGVAAYEVGELEVPAIPVSYLDAHGEVRSVQTSPITLKVKGLLAEDEANPEVQPLRQPRSALVEDKRIMKLVRWGSALFGGALLLTGMVLLGVRLFKRRAAEAPVADLPRRPPDDVAMEKLRALRAAGNFSADGYRPFYFAVAEIVRAYLGARYGFDSLELTSTELMDELRARAPHLAPADGEVARFLGDTDLVKFARSGSSDEAALKALDAAQAIVLSTAAQQTVAAPVPMPLDGAGHG